MPGEACGNGEHDQGEECDDHNTAFGDGCTAGCQVETDWSCPEVGPCTNNAICGNGILSSSEVCDDGNTADGDGCNASCSGVEMGWQCRVPGKKCVPLCGDGIIIQTAVATEGCDDHNTTDGDGCSSSCGIEPHWSCMGMPSACTQAQCGNGMKETGETCDAGDLNGLFYGNGMGCSKTCTQEPKCRNDAGVTGACEVHCGDGNIDMGEDCDDGNQLNFDGCSDQCKKEDGFTCTNETRPDTVDCPSAPGTQCLVLPMIFRDFDPSTNPDFFYLGKNGVQCVPDASGTPATITAGGPCATNDQSGPCLGLASATLDADGTPGPGKTTMCRCIFTDHDNTGVITGGTTCSRTDGSNVPHIETMIQGIKDIKKWYSDSGAPPLYGKLELAASGTQFQFSSSVMGAPAGAAGTTVQEDIHANCLTPGARPLQSGFFPFDAMPPTGGAGTKYCNLWPYWALGTSEADCTTGSSLTIKGQWDPDTTWDGCPAAGTDGGFVPKSDGTGTPLKGEKHDFYYTSVARYLFVYSGTPSTLSFFGDDDVFVYVNGKLKVDLGAPHQQLMGMATIGDAADGLEVGKVYEIAVFHADRHPRDANYQLTLSSFATTISNCGPTCGDGVATSTEECDLGAGNTGEYGGCDATCHYGGWCGDGVTQPEGGEECDNGVAGNGMNYIKDPPTDPNAPFPCTVGCKKAHFCGDGQIDGTQGEQCDQGAMVSKSCTGCMLGIR